MSSPVIDVVDPSLRGIVAEALRDTDASVAGGGDPKEASLLLVAGPTTIAVSRWQQAVLAGSALTFDDWVDAEGEVLQAALDSAAHLMRRVRFGGPARAGIGAWTDSGVGARVRAAAGVAEPDAVGAWPRLLSAGEAEAVRQVNASLDRIYIAEENWASIIADGVAEGAWATQQPDRLPGADRDVTRPLPAPTKRRRLCSAVDEEADASCVTGELPSEIDISLASGVLVGVLSRGLRRGRLFALDQDPAWAAFHANPARRKRKLADVPMEAVREELERRSEE